jgi:hypothetical protein
MEVNIYIYIYWILDLENEVNLIWVILQMAFKNAKVKPSSGIRPGLGAEPLAFSVMPLPTTLTSATLVRDI